jgi:signal transduction histidine kinase/CHASE3 domain sensor protein
MTTATALKLSAVRRGLTPWILVAAGIVVASLVIGSVVSWRSYESVRRQDRAEQRSEQAVVAASRVERLVLDLETGTRGFVLTRDPSFLEPWRSAQRLLPGQIDVLRAQVSGPKPEQIDAMWRSYLNDWSKPVIDLARRDKPAATTRVRQGEGKRRIDALRAALEQVLETNLRAAEASRERIEHSERQGLVVAVGGAAVRIVIVLLSAALFLRAAIGPLRRIALATRKVAGGELETEVAEEGAGEVRELAGAFNAMSRSLLRNQRALEDQNVDLERLANVLRAVLDSTVDGILLSDADGNVQLANRPVINLTRDLGMTYEGTVVDRLLSVESRVAHPEQYRAAMERLRNNASEPTFDEFEDTVSGRVFQGFTAPVFDDRGAFLGRIWTLRDVTQQRELDRLKEDFVATVSHELRTPLTSMMGFLEMIREGEAGELNDEQQRFLAIVYRSSERLQRLVGDLLFVARLDANGLQLQFGEVSLEDIVRETVESTAALARSRELDLRQDLREVPALSGDRERLSQLVGNLVGNAIKFTPAGGRVTVRTFAARGNAVVEVEDTGIGIPPAEQSQLFQRFFRSSTATEHAIPGTGLGLVISRAIAEAHGGSIDVRSRPGEGTCFRVELPLEPEEIAA